MKKGIVFDIETNGLVPDKIYCLVTKYEDGSHLKKFVGHNVIKNKGLKELDEADYIIAHNGIRFDLPVLKKILKWSPKARVYDTLILAQMFEADIAEKEDMQHFATDKKKATSDKTKFLGKNIGRHSLKVWGLRLGFLKGDYESSWEKYTDEMLEYCVRDVDVTIKLWRRLKRKINKENIDAIRLEHWLADLLRKSQHTGIYFNKDKGENILKDLERALKKNKKDIKNIFPSRFEPLKWEDNNPQIPRKERIGVSKKQQCTPIILREINPNSRLQVITRLLEMDFCLTATTETGLPKLDNNVLLNLEKKYKNDKEKLIIVEALQKNSLIKKRLDMLYMGKNGWLKLIDEKSFIHPFINNVGTITARATHSKPNISQVPAIKTDKNNKPVYGENGKWGADFRSLFCANKEEIMVGADLKSLELCCLAHYLAPFDDKHFLNILQKKDVHEENRRMLGLDNRTDAKRVIFCFIYGGGPEKIGEIIAPAISSFEKRILGKKILTRLNIGLPGIKLLLTYLRSKNRTYIKALDGRLIPVRKEYALLNTLLQSAGAIICKYWIKNIFSIIGEEDYNLLIWSHDELQFASKKSNVQPLIKALHRGAKRIRSDLNLVVDIECDVKTGNTWADTH